MRCRRPRDVLIRDQKNPRREILKNTGERRNVHTHTHTHTPTRTCMYEIYTQTRAYIRRNNTDYTDTLSLPFSLVDHARRKREGTSGVSETKDAYNRQWTTAPRHFRVAGRGYRSNQSTS